MGQAETPHQIAAKIAAENTRKLRKGSKSKVHQGGGETVAAALEQILVSGPCGGCQRLVANESKSQIGCTYDGMKPNSLAIQGLTTMVHKLKCEGREEITTASVVDISGVLHYATAAPKRT